MLVRNLSTGRTVDDTRNEEGNERYALALALDVAWEIQDARELASIAVETRKDVSAFVEWLADATRQHAIDNELCGNYEAFLSVEVGNWVRNNRENSAVSDAMAFVVNATRPRKVTVKVAVPVTVTRYSRHDDIDMSSLGYSMRRGNNDSGIVIDEWAAKTLESECEALDYDTAQRVNEQYRRTGGYGLASNGDDEQY